MLKNYNKANEENNKVHIRFRKIKGSKNIVKHFNPKSTFRSRLQQCLLRKKVN
jgi:hypothetical protein